MTSRQVAKPQFGRYAPVGGKRGPASETDSDTSSDGEDDGPDESDAVSLTALSWVLGIHFFAMAVTVPALPSLVLDIMKGAARR